MNLDVPVDSPLVEIRSLGVGSKDAEIRVRNKSDKVVQIRVNLLVTPDGPERTHYRERLAAGEERSYSIAFPAAKGKRKLWVGVAIDNPESYINRTYAIPASR